MIFFTFTVTRLESEFATVRAKMQAYLEEPGV